jgi:hypothetical protein
MTWVKLMICFRGLWMVDLYMASKFQVFIFEIIQGIWKCDTRYKNWVLVDVKVLSLDSILLENHILFWGSIICLFMQVQMGNFWEVKITFVNTLQCWMFGISKGAIRMRYYQMLKKQCQIFKSQFWTILCKILNVLQWSVSRYGRFYLSWLVVVVFDFHCANDYIVANNVFLVGMVFIRGWCWGLMTKGRKFEL